MCDDLAGAVGPLYVSDDEFTPETAKWVGPLLSPASGKIAEVNGEVVNNPPFLNEDPYGKGWMVVIEACTLEDDLNRLVNEDQPAAVEWLNTDIREIAKENFA